MDPNKPINWYDIPIINCVDGTERCIKNCKKFCKEGNTASTEAPSARSACLKLLLCVIYYVPFLMLFTHNYPDTTTGCLVEFGSLMCEPPKGKGGSDV